MAFDVNPRLINAIAAGDLSASPYCFGTINSSGQVALATEDSKPDGVIYGKPTAQGQSFPLATSPGDVVVVKTGGSFSIGDLLETDASGQAVVYNDSAVVAKALEASTGSGQFVAALLLLSRSTS